VVTSLLSTKFYIPPPRPELMLRPRLIERLNKCLHHKITLISAPVGYGKTTILSERALSRKSPEPIIWVSLDKDDNDPAAQNKRAQALV
jgi:LuxR family maltose regulon positive regulatory protein